MWKEIRNLGILPKTKKELHGFIPNEPYAHFATVSVSPDEN